MTRSSSERRLPGSVLLRLARWIFDETAYSVVVCPAIADLQQEVRDAGANRSRRIRAWWRGYVAFWRLVVVAPFALPSLTLDTGRPTLSFGRNGGGALVLLVTVLVAGTWPVFGGFAIAAVTGGLFLAIVMRVWHNRHPSTLGDTASGMSRRPEINFASIPVGGNAAGLIVAIGSVVIVFIGLPGLRWFLLIPIVAGSLLATTLFAWRTAHPPQRMAPNSIARR
jgi:hypothetical protein